VATPIDVPALLDAIAWPAVVLAIVFLIRAKLPSMIEQLAGRVKKLDLAGVSIELAEARPYAPAWTGAGAVADLRHAAQAFEMTDSGRASFVTQLMGPAEADYAEVDLGDGRQWLSSRLFIMAELFPRMKRVRCFLFVERKNGHEKRHLGWVDPAALRYALAREYPWLESAFADAYDQILKHGARIASSHGKLISAQGGDDAAVAIDLLGEFLRRVQTPPPPAPLQPPIPTVDVNGVQEQARWLSGGAIEALLGPALIKTHLSATQFLKAEPKEQIRMVLAAPGDFLILTSDKGAIERVLKRDALIDQIGRQLN
jgi:hypothetical protein